MSSTASNILPVGGSQGFVAEEEKVLAYWNEIKAFETSLKQSEGKKPYTFYDGPPFATGLPHYGHILAGTIKDIVTRYAHQTGHHVERKFGWDCHGLPVEYEIDKKLGIKDSTDVKKMGIDKYNDECRSIVMRYSGEWESTVHRIGRWIDFKNGYKTLDTPYMESVWWVFSQLVEKKLVYPGFKVMPYSTACKTPLSNFEAGENYKLVTDPAVVVSFPLVEDPTVSLLAWTTTPWTLPSNLALCVNPELDYVKVLDAKTGDKYILGEARLTQLYKKKKKKSKAPAAYTILEKFKGAALKGKKYVPLFEYFRAEEKAHPNQWTVLTDGYVEETGGTMVVHQAPAFGEDDYRVCLAANVIGKGNDIPCPVNEDGCFTEAVSDFKGRFVKEADDDICRQLKEKGRLLQKTVIHHQYPHCWRSDTPLIYKAVPSWFIDVPQLREQLLVNNQKTYWVPQNIRDNRFGEWLKNARPWAVSRNRYWGTPLPIWANADLSEWIVVGGIEDLKEKSGYTGEITDLHMHNIDHITIPSKTEGNPPLKRIPEVFDCWFESGSMPYAQAHYPFENKDRFDGDVFPADFIAEGLDQTRGWFYTLMVLSTALFNKPAFKNLIVNGLVLAKDGRKMSKRHKNYPPVDDIINKYGADALRLYLINSNITCAEPLKFKEEGVKAVVRDIIIPWFNSYKLFVDQSLLLDTPFVHDVDNIKKTDNVMDKWIISSLQSLIAFIRQEMAGYRLYTVIPKLLKFVDTMSRWYIRFNKDRLKGVEGPEQRTFALNTLFEVLFGLTVLMAPLAPFFVETLYQNLKNGLAESEKAELYGDSVHYLMIPEVKTDLIDGKVEASVEWLQKAIKLGNKGREQIAGVGFRVPLQHLTVAHQDPTVTTLLRSPAMTSYLESNLNVRKVIVTDDYTSLASFSVKPNQRSLGSKFGKQRGAVVKLIAALSQLDLGKLDNSETVAVTDASGAQFNLEKADVLLQCEFSGDEKVSQASNGDGFLLVFPRVPDADCVVEGNAREIMSKVQRMRKELKLAITDKISLAFFVVDAAPAFSAALKQKEELISTYLKAPVTVLTEAPSAGAETFEFNGETVLIVLTRV